MHQVLTKLQQLLTSKLEKMSHAFIKPTVGLLVNGRKIHADRWKSQIRHSIKKSAIISHHLSNLPNITVHIKGMVCAGLDDEQCDSVQKMLGSQSKYVTLTVP